MNKIKKELRREADQMLPASESKEKLKKAIFGETNAGLDEASAPRKKGYGKKLWLQTAVAFTLILSVSLGLAFGLQAHETDSPVVSDTFVSIDINPSFEIIADENDIVTSIKPLNNDGVIVLYGTKYKGQPLDAVCAAIVESSLSLDYINAAHNDIKLLTSNKDGDKEKQVAENIRQIISDTLSSKGSSASVTVKNSAKGGKQELLEEALAQLDLDLMGISEDDLEKMSAAEINQLLKRYNAKDLDDLEDILENLYEQAGLDPDDDEFEDKMDELKKNWKKEHGDKDDDDEDEDNDEDED